MPAVTTVIHNTQLQVMLQTHALTHYPQKLKHTAVQDGKAIVPLLTQLICCFSLGG